MRLRCLRTGFLIDARAAGLSEAERLRMEEHIADCPACRRDYQDLIRIADVTGEGARALSSSARERAIGGALDGASAGSPALPARRLRPAFALGAGLAAAAAGVAFYLAGRAEERPLAFTPPAVPVVERGEPAGVVSAPVGRPLRYAHARVEPRRDAVLVWEPAEATIHLRGGALDVFVDPAPHKPFRVTTSRFAVDVLGTEFAIDEEQVTVREGAVRVTALDGEILAALRAGESWSVEPEPEPEIVPDPEPAPAPAKKRRPAPSADDRDRCELARDAIASGVEGERWAEEQTVLAECALATGNRKKAVRLYLAVAGRHPDASVGERALFAAARNQVHLERGRAVELLRAYLERYPHGMYPADAKRLLKELGEPP
jgi:anti-sigma factor RsiW